MPLFLLKNDLLQWEACGFDVICQAASDQSVKSQQPKLCDTDRVVQIVQDNCSDITCLILTMPYIPYYVPYLTC
jgi:hypothetical protein